MAQRLKIGDKVKWNWSVGGTNKRGTITGKIFETNTQDKVSASRFGVIDEKGERYYPVVKLKRMI